MLIKKLAPALAAVALLALPFAALASEEEGGGPRAGNDIHNRASLQRGARNFMNYCSGCHSAKFVRYNRIAADLGIDEATLKSNLMFTSSAPADTIVSSLAPADGTKWFGNAPPDLSLMSRSRGTDHIYAFLKSFYSDPSRPNGVNNTVLPGTAMPAVLVDLQGLQKAVFKPAAAEGAPEFEKFELVSKGTLTPEQFDDFVRDTVNFLQYMGEPIQAKREDLGVWVILFLLAFTGFAYMMYKEYWKDVH